MAIWVVTTMFILEENYQMEHILMRVLTLKELFIVSSLPENMDLPEWCTDNLIRTVIGEAIPPLFSKNIVKGIGELEND